MTDGIGTSAITDVAAGAAGGGVGVNAGGGGGGAGDAGVPHGSGVGIMAAVASIDTAADAAISY